MIFISSWKRTHSHVDPPKKLYETQCNFSSKITKLLCSNPFFQQILRHYKESRKVILREPFSGREIRLPPIRRLAALSVLGSNRTPTRYVLSIDPDLSSKDNAFVLMISCSDSLNVAFFKSGNKQWVYIE